MTKGKILVVDDDKNICELLRLYIEKEGYDIEIANDGQEALTKFKEVQPDLIMLDIMLPIHDGLYVCREIRKTSQVPIIMLTAKGEVFDKVLGLELGADDYVVKPFEAKEIIARIKAVLRRTGGDKVEEEIKLVKYDKLSINLTNYELKEFRLILLRRSLSLFITLQAIQTEYSLVTSFLMRSGALITTVTHEQLMSMSNALEKS